LMVHAGDGAAAMSPVAVALHGSGTRVLSLTLRTPTLDDVFLQLTGAHLQADEANTEGAATDGHGGVTTSGADGHGPDGAGHVPAAATGARGDRR
ncbi:MAG TPA: hypothetical protein VN799_07190, partial [Acidimicrobiales bacterium]|nr:hypothetical protein [Acidimicrobiales bacterium]